MCSWRSDAIKGLSQHKLNQDYDFKVEDVHSKGTSKGGRTKRKVCQLSRETKKEEEEESDTSPQPSTKRSHISLTKSNDIITEHNM